MGPMNPVPVSLLVFIVVAVLAALVAGLGVGLRLARSRMQATVDAALAQAGHAAQLELAQAQERLRAHERAAAVMQAELDRARGDAQAASNELRRISASEAQKNQHVASLNERVADLEQKSRDAAALLDARNAALQTAHGELAQARTRADAERASAQEKLQLLTEAKTALSDQFKTLATEILEEKSKRFAEQNQQNLGTLLDPLRTQLSEFKGKVEEARSASPSPSRSSS
jgi:DNA recombination protein RmuC